VQVYTAALELLKKVGASQETQDGFKSKCREKVPLALAFTTDEERTKRVERGQVNGVANGDKADV
jgi:hypothetical protein